MNHQIRALVLGAASAHCTLALDDRPEPDGPAPGASGEPSAYRLELDSQRGAALGRAWSSDCEAQMSVYEVEAPEGSAALRFVGLLASPRERSAPPVGQAIVDLSRAGPSVLVLSAVERTHWTVHTDVSTKLEGIYLVGTVRHSIRSPAGVPIFNYSGESILPPGPTLVWPDEPSVELVFSVELITGLTLTSFHGCERMSQLALFEEPGDSDCTTLDRIAGSCGLATFDGGAEAP